MAHSWHTQSELDTFLAHRRLRFHRYDFPVLPDIVNLRRLLHPFTTASTRISTSFFMASAPTLFRFKIALPAQHALVRLVQVSFAELSGQVIGKSLMRWTIDGENATFRRKRARTPADGTDRQLREGQ
jgi:hypothetical protein